MKLIAKLILTDFTENNIMQTETVHAVDNNETVEALMTRLMITGSAEWHYRDAEVRLKLVKGTE